MTRKDRIARKLREKNKELKRQVSQGKIDIEQFWDEMADTAIKAYNNFKLNGEEKVIISYLNEKTGQNYRTNSKTSKEKIQARLNEGFTVEDFKKVIDIKYEQWRGSKFSEFLRPQTLFCTNFESYLNQALMVEKKDNLKNNEILLKDGSIGLIDGDYIRIHGKWYLYEKSQQFKKVEKMAKKIIKTFE